MIRDDNEFFVVEELWKLDQGLYQNIYFQLDDSISSFSIIKISRKKQDGAFDFICFNLMKSDIISFFFIFVRVKYKKAIEIRKDQR